MKKVFFGLLAFIASLNVNAQYINNKFFDNWSIGVNGGVQTNLHDWNTPQGAVTGITFTKQITPVFGLTFEGQIGWNNLANWNHNGYDKFLDYLSNGNPAYFHTQPFAHVHNGNAVDAVGVYALGNVNLMNWWGGYNCRPRVFEVVPFAGVGYGHTFFNSTYGNNVNHVLAKVGTSLDFNLGKERAWSINLRPAVVYNVAQGAAHNYAYGLKMQHAVFEATAGVTYHFKTSNGTHHMIKHYCPAIPEPIQPEVIRDTIEIIKEVPMEKYIETPIVLPEKQKLIIGFAFDSIELSPEAKEGLHELARNYKEAEIVAYASYEDKTAAAYNMKLSEKRAAVIKSFLEDCRVKVKACEGLGSLTKESNRIAIITFS